MPKKSVKKTVKITAKPLSKKITKATKVGKAVKSASKPRRELTDKPLLFREIELGAMGVFVVVLIILFIGVAGSLALSFASSAESAYDSEYPLLYRMFYPTEATVEVEKVRQPMVIDSSPAPESSAIPVKISN